jgi:oxygen-dependent protoporphyrinogen oxidase
VLDGGPDSWVATKPQATSLANSLGLQADLVPTIEATRRVYIAWNEELHALPEGLVLAVPTRVGPVVRTRLFSWGGKARMALEPLVPRRTYAKDEDESIADFIARRLGTQVAERLASPLLGGIFAGDARALSIRAAFPQLVEMEAKHGSLVRAMRASRRAAKKRGPAKGATPSAFLSLKGGLGGLVDALVARLREEGARVELRTQACVRGVSRLPGSDTRGRWALDVEGGDPLFAHDVLFAAPAHATSNLVREVDAELAALLGRIPYVSTATVFLAFRRADIHHPLDAVGFIVPRGTGRPLLAATWVSSKWEHRAPAGHVLMRLFFGGAWGEAVLANDDDAMVALARKELRDLMKVEAEPLFSRVFRFARSNPQPVVGHLGTLAAIRERLHDLPGVYLAGSGYDGIGIPDCVRQAEEAAKAILANAQPSSEPTRSKGP